MRTGQKRKRSTANNDITSSTTTSNNNNNNTSSNNTNRGRQRLQRASKDKVYAERLAAAGNNDHDFNGLLSNSNSGGIDDSINESSKVGACASSQQSNGNGSKRSTRSSKSIASKSNNSTSNTTTTRSKRTKSTRRNTEKVLSPPPPNWPFTSNSSSNSSAKVSGGKAAKGVDNCGRKKSTRGNSSGKSGGDKLSLPPNWPFTEPTVAKGGAAKGGGAKKKSSSSRGSSSKGSTSCESTTSADSGSGGDKSSLKQKKSNSATDKHKQQPVAPCKQSLQQLRQEEEDKGDDVGKEEIMSTTRSTRSGKVREMKSTAVSKSKQEECGDLVDSDEDSAEKKKLPVSMKQPTIDKLSPPTSISTSKSPTVSTTKATAAASTKSYTKPTSIDKLSPPTLQNHTEPVSKATAAPKTTKSSTTIDKLSPPTLQSNTKPSKPKLTAPKAKAASKTTKTTTDWSCNRCTLLNNNRKKKCTACGTPRYLTVGLDGTFALDENRGSSSASARMNSTGKVNDNAAGEESGVPSSYCAAAAADEEGEQSEESQQSQLSAMIDAPVFTRSRRREHLSLTQSSSPTKPVNAKEDEVKVEAKEGDNTRNDEDNDQPEENDESQSSSNHIPLQLEQQQEQQNKESEQQPSEFKQWIQKRHEKKREKKAKKRQRRKSLVPTKVVNVRPFVNGEHILLDSNDASMNANVDGEQSESSQQQQQILEAVVEISVLCRIEERSNVEPTGAASEDNERGEQSTPQESDSSEKPLIDEEESVCQERPMEDEGSMEQKLPQGSAIKEVLPQNEEGSSITETRPVDGDDLIAKLAASTLLNMQCVSVGAPSSDQVPPQKDQVSVTSPCLKESVDDSTLAAKSEVDKPSSEEIPEEVLQQQPEEVTDHDNTVNKPIDKDDCAKEVVADVCRHDDTAKLPADSFNRGNNNIFNYDETSQVPNHDECNNKLNEQECSTSSVSDGRQKEETLPPNEASHKKDEDKSQQNQGQVAYHEEAKRDLAISTTYPSNSQGVASIHSPFIQMTQQLPDFDYMSQVCYYVLFITQITLNLFHDRLNLTIFSVSGFIWYPNELYGQDSPASGRKKIYRGSSSKFKCQDFVIRSTTRATSRDKGCPS